MGANIFIWNLGVRSILLSFAVSNGFATAKLYILYRAVLWKKGRIRIRRQTE